LGEAGANALDGAGWVVERPKRAEHGDLATNAAMALAKRAGKLPRVIAEGLDVEFVSANPTGPVTVASGRNAVLGDTIARLLEATGNRVTREYYVNDR